MECPRWYHTVSAQYAPPLSLLLHSALLFDFRSEIDLDVYGHFSIFSAVLRLWVTAEKTAPHYLYSFAC